MLTRLRLIQENGDLTEKREDKMGHLIELSPNLKDILRDLKEKRMRLL